jgi:hypothetical protein
MTRRDRVKSALREAHGNLCALEAFYRSGELHNGRNAIPELRDEGWEIATEWRRHGDAPAHAHYIVKRDPDRQPKQLTLVSA